MSEQKEPHLPIGYWLKKADEVLTSRINAAQQANGLTRIEWQILNLLYDTSGATRPYINEILRPFSDEASLATTVESLINRGLVQEAGSDVSQLRLTDEGHLVHRAAVETQTEVRQRAVQGISEADYRTTIRVLQRLVANLTDGGK